MKLPDFAATLEVEDRDDDVTQPALEVAQPAWSESSDDEFLASKLVS